MSLPTKDEQSTLQIVHNGRPACIVEAKPLNSYSLQIIHNGRPAVGAPDTSSINVLVSWWAWNLYGGHR